MAARGAINRTQLMVLGFFSVAWTAIAVLLAVSADVRDETLRRVPGSGASTVVGFLAALALFLTLLAVGVLRRWRWLFWLLLVAFAAGALRLPVAVLQLTGRMTSAVPDWYVVVQGVVGVVQFGIAIGMFVGYRRSGPWGSI